MNDIIPAILPRSTIDLDSKLAQIPPEIELIHLDVLEEDIWTKIDTDFEVHLMVKKPEELVEKWINRGARNIVLHKFSEKINNLKATVRVGLAVELDVELEDIYQLVPSIDFIQLMSISHIGVQGSPLDERIFGRILRVREKFPKLEISVDGGINETNLEQLKKVGANKFIVGSGFNNLWKSLTRN